MDIKYIITIHHKGFFAPPTVFNLTDKAGGEGDFYAYEDGCFKLYCKNRTFVFPLDKIDCVDIKEL